MLWRYADWYANLNLIFTETLTGRDKLLELEFIIKLATDKRMTNRGVSWLKETPLR